MAQNHRHDWVTLPGWSRVRAWLALPTIVVAAACGTSVQFEKAVGTGKFAALPSQAAIALEKDVDSLPQPAAILGVMRLHPTKATSSQSRAEEALLDAAAAYGCDAIADVQEERVDPSAGKPGRSEDDKDYQWSALCVRTAKADSIATAPVVKAAPPQPSPTITAAEKEKAKAAAKADKARKEAERMAAIAADEERKAKLAAEALERERSKQSGADKDAERKRKETEADERAKKEAEAAEKDRKKRDAEAEKARKEADDKAKREAEAAEKDRKKRDADADKARKEAEDKAKKETDAAERDRKKKEAEAEKAKREADDRARRDGETAEKTRKEAEAQERTKREAEEKTKREAEEKTKREAEEKTKREANEKARKDAEDRSKRETDDKAKKDAEVAAPKPAKSDKASKAPVDWKAKFEAAATDDSEAAWLALLAGMPDGDDADRAFDRLQRAARGKSANWLTADAPKVSLEEGDTAPIGDPAQLKKDLTEGGATTARFILPREYSYTWTLRNPTKLPVVVDFKTPTGRVARVIEGGSQATGVVKGACPPLGPPLRSKVGLVLEYRFGCDVAKVVPKLGLIRPAKRDLAIDKKAADPEASPETIAKVWAANPGTRLVDIHLMAIDEAMRRRSDDMTVVQGKVFATDKPSASGTTPIRIELRNTSARDLTVVFDPGSGVDQRLLVPKKSAADMKMELPAGKQPELKIHAVLPRLRALDWLVGLWAFQGVSLVILPSPSGGLVAFAIEPQAGDDLPPKLTSLGVHVATDITVLQADLPGLIALAMFADKTPATCEKKCQMTLKIRLVDQDRYIAGAGRVLLTTVEIPGKSGTFEFATDR